MYGYSQIRADSSSQRQRVQSRSEQRRGAMNFYRRSLKVDSAKAEAVSAIQTEYKTSMNALLANKGLNEESRRVQLKSLQIERNRKLRRILNPEQQQKVIPSTERY